jgi:hypothetical protein
LEHWTAAGAEGETRFVTKAKFIFERHRVTLEPSDLAPVGRLWNVALPDHRQQGIGEDKHGSHQQKFFHNYEHGGVL